MKKIGDKHTNNTFENIRHIDEYGNEYCFARELQKIASSARVKNIAEFHNAGYKGLYNGETADECLTRVLKKFI